MTNYPELIEKTFNAFNGKNLSSLDDFYSANIVFEDPIKKVQGLDNLKKYFTHAYSNVLAISFKFDEFVVQENRVGAAWTMSIKVKGIRRSQEYSVPGFSLFKFDESGKALSHRDYLDLGALIYEHLPLMGRTVLFIKRLLAQQK